jgi:hypothetical protein
METNVVGTEKAFNKYVNMYFGVFILAHLLHEMARVKRNT